MHGPVNVNKENCISAHCIFNLNTSVSGHTQGTVGFP